MLTTKTITSVQLSLEYCHVFYFLQFRKHVLPNKIVDILDQSTAHDAQADEKNRREENRNHKEENENCIEVIPEEEEEEEEKEEVWHSEYSNPPKCSIFKRGFIADQTKPPEEVQNHEMKALTEFTGLEFNFIKNE